MVLEAIPAEILLRELVALDHRPHRPVEDEDSGRERAIESARERGGMCEARGAVIGHFVSSS